jgi:hypothetical protein
MSYEADAMSLVGDTAARSVRDVPTLIVQLINVARFELRKIYGNKRLSLPAQTADAQAVQAIYERAVDAIKANVEAALEKAAGAPAWYRPADPVLWEAQALRIWQRIERQLTAGVGVQSIVQRASREELQVMSEELEAWLRSNDPSINDTAVAVNMQAFRELAAARMLGLWNEFELVQWKDAEAQAKGAYNVRLTVAYAKGDVMQGKTIVRWDGTVVQLDPEPVGLPVM